MKKLLLLAAAVLSGSALSAQSINIPTDYELGYHFGFHSHQLSAAAELEMGIGLEGFAQTSLLHPGSADDKFYVGLRYRWEGVTTPKWEGTVSVGGWTTGLFYNFPVYPINFGSRGAINYRINDKLSVGPNVFIAPSASNSEMGLGLVYKLY